VLFIVGCGGGGSGGSSNNQGNRWTIGSGGGTYRTSANEVRLVVPPGAVSSNTMVNAEKLTPAPTPPTNMAYVAGSGWSFTHVNFTTPASLSLAFPAGTPASVKMYRRADGATEWTPLETTVDAAARLATAQVTSFSSYALFYSAGTGWNWTDAGGDFTFEGMTIHLPEDAMPADTEVQARRTPAPFAAPEGWTSIPNASYDLGASNTSLETENDFSVTITYDAASVPAATREGVRVFYKENEAAAWTILGTQIPDAANLKATGHSRTLGTFAAFYPTPVTGNAWWVEQRLVQGNQMVYDVYTANSGANETLAYTVPQILNNNQIRVNTFRWSDKSFLGLDFSDPNESRMVSRNIETNVATSLFVLPKQTGFYISSLEVARNRRAGGDDYAVQTSQRNQDTGANRDQLLLFRDGATTPQVLMTLDRTDSETPMISRPWDVVDGKVLALTQNGLTLFNGTSQFTIAAAEDGPGEAYFSPDGNRVLFVKQSGANAGWNVYNLTTFTTTPVPNLSGHLIRWATDTHVITAVTSGDARHIELVNVETGAASRITTAGAHTNSMINDVGAR
jgi:hypothetical protein